MIGGLNMIYALQSSLYAVLVLVVVFISLKKHQDLKSMNNRYYVSLIVMMISVLLIDMLSVIFDGKSFLFNHILMNILIFLLYVLGVWIAFTWVLFVRHNIFKYKHMVMKHIGWLILPLIINTIISFASMFTNIFFHINAQNSYERGDYFVINFFINYGYLIYSLILLYVHRKQIIKKDMYALIMFPLLPFFGSVIQIFFYGTLLIWPMAALSLLIIFIFIQARLINIDPLTELYNKRELSNFIFTQARRKEFNQLIGGIFIDIDNFKLINDTYGHAKGDEVLITFASVLRKSFRKEDFIARIGGDEFAAFVFINETSDLDIILSKLNQAILDLNAQKIIHETISVSMGYDIFNATTHRNFEHFVSILDRKMYEIKSTQKNN
jgi:diguanylate cyclase (GGDEF)-like protein